jgi:signal transduction histidine kinase
MRTLGSVRRRRVDRGQVAWATTVGLSFLEAAVVEARHGSLAVRLLAVGAAAAGITLRRRSTLWCAAGAAVGTVIGVLGGADSLGLFVLSAAALGWCGYAGRSSLTALGAPALVVVSGVGATLATVPAADRVGSITWTCVFYGVAWSVGVGVERLRSQARRAEELAVRTEADAEARVRAALAEERRRIAADLHDVLAHSLTAVSVQAGAAAKVIDADPAAARASLTSIQRVGADAVGELRRLFDVLDAGTAPAVADGATSQPTLTNLTALCADARAMGLDVHLETEGDLADVAPGPAAAMYRIVQEALTNSRRHGGRCAVDVRIARRPLVLVAEVVTRRTNGATVEPGSTSEGTGRGLLGMRERVALYGGSLDAGPTPSGWTVRAEIPVGQPALSSHP